jgi:CheY-like chemotaxis protein
MKATLASINVTTVEEAGDGQDALAKMEAFKPDLMLCDWNMPVMDGITFVRQLRGKSDRTPVIMITTEARRLASSKQSKPVSATMRSSRSHPIRSKK